MFWCLYNQVNHPVALLHLITHILGNAIQTLILITCYLYSVGTALKILRVTEPSLAGSTRAIVGTANGDNHANNLVLEDVGEGALLVLAIN